MAVNTIWAQNDNRFCRVYELTDADRDEDTHMYKWSEVHNLGDYALFLGQRCPSKAVPMPTGVRGRKSYSTYMWASRAYPGRPCYASRSVHVLDKFAQITLKYLT
jgi:hypothetical protein